MHILFLTPRLPYPPNRGDRIRPWNFAKSLAKEHRLSLLSFIQAEEERNHLGNLKQVFDSVELVLLKPWRSYYNVASALLSPLPLQTHYFDSPKMHEKVKEFLLREKVDVTYVFHLRMAPYAVALGRTYRILDLVDSVSLFLQRRLALAPVCLKPVLALEQMRVSRYERGIAPKFDETWLVSPIDRDAVCECKAPSNLFVIPNGVDTDYFRPLTVKPRSPNVIFVGYMGAESIDAVSYFYREIFPLVRQNVPEARFFIVGANPPHCIKMIGKDKNVIVTGFIEDLRPYYNNAAVAIAPMRFVVGMQNKVLEAMAMELPVVATTCANEGIDARDGEEVFVANSPDQFAARVTQLLSDWELGQRMGAKARRFVKNRFSWDVAAHRIEQVGRLLPGS